jgi:hypothetical protein
LIGFSIELSLLVLSRSDRKSFKNFFGKLRAHDFFAVPTEEEKHQTAFARHGAPDLLGIEVAPEKMW